MKDETKRMLSLMVAMVLILLAAIFSTAASASEENAADKNAYKAEITATDDYYYLQDR
jgi:flagellar basal body-associated protein FliL